MVDYAKIKSMEKKSRLDKFVCTAHACSIALIDHEDQELVTCTDYEFPYHKYIKEYPKIVPSFNEVTHLYWKMVSILAFNYIT